MSYRADKLGDGHFGPEWRIYVSINYTSIVSDNDMSPARRRVII